MDPAAADEEDARYIELETLEAIYPEIRRLSEAEAGDQDAGPSGDSRGLSVTYFTFELELPVEPSSPVTVTFPAASTASASQRQQQQWQQQPHAVGGAAGSGVLDNGSAVNPSAPEGPEVDSLQVSHLPPVCLRITLPQGYPGLFPPIVKVSTTPPWLSDDTLSRLQTDAQVLWEDSGRDLVAYTYVDHVQQAADDVFGAITAAGTLEVDAEHKLAVLDYDINAKRASFERETFECGICLDPKKGSKCHKMVDCGHVFCIQCLQDFYNDAIHEGNLSTVKCLTPKCAKERSSRTTNEPGGQSSTGKQKIFISPSELLQIGLSEETVKRYVTLKYKTELESDKNTIYCPRQWCNGAARSKKHKKPEGFEMYEGLDGESDEENKAEEESNEKEKAPVKPQKNKFNRADFLAICEDCAYAFCSRCEQSWHGEFVICTPTRNRDELTEEEKASLEYLRLHSSPCPTCNAPAQKSHGCNHMICSRCDTHFCYLCSAWLNPGNPYQHYNQQSDGKVTSCYMRLWELEGGDGDDVGIGFGGGDGPARPAAAGGVEEADLIQIVEEEDEPGDEPNVEDNNAVIRPLDENGQPVVVAREAPLVLRLFDDQPRGGQREAGQPAQPAQPVVQRAPIAGRGQNVPARGVGRGNHRGEAAPRGREARGGRARADRGRARGRGGRGGGGGGAVAVAVAAAHQVNGIAQQPRQRQDGQGLVGDDLDPAQQAWVRRFVQMALIDAEDEVEGDSDEDDDNWRIR